MNEQISYLNLTEQQLDAGLKIFREIANKEYHLIGKPLYDFYTCIKEKREISQDMQEAADIAHKHWNSIVNLWNDDSLNLIQAFMIEFKYSGDFSFPEYEETKAGRPILDKDMVESLTREEVFNLIDPPPYKPSEKEIQYYRYMYMFEDSLFDKLSGLSSYFSKYNREKNGETVSENDVDSIFSYNVDNYAKNYFKNYEATQEGKDVIDLMVPNDWFYSAYVEGLSDFHSGDCTAIACSCIRCHAENLFKVPYTANWSKHTGSHLHGRYFKILDTDKKRLD